jgi:carotenoid 1,2-hydratase
MRITADLRDDIWHNLSDASYEWWYFDAISADGYGLVITFFYGLPFSPNYQQAILAHEKTGQPAPPDQYCSFYCCLYGPQRTEAYALNEYSIQHFAAHSDTPSIQIGRSSFIYHPEKGFQLHLDTPALQGRHIYGDLTFRPQFLLASDTFNSFNNNLLATFHQPTLTTSTLPTTEHVWNCVAPICQVTGELEVTSWWNKTNRWQFQGYGYHDHNYGIRQMHHDMQHWVWGRLHTPQFTSVYYLIEPSNPSHSSQNFWLILDHQTAQPYYVGNALVTGNRQTHFMGVDYYSELNLSHHDNLQLHVRANRRVDTGPFYLRFLANQQLSINGQIHENIGFSEAFRPERLLIKRFWPFIKMRIRRP